MAQRATKEQVKNFRPSVKGRSFKHDGPRSRKSKTLDRSPHDGQKKTTKKQVKNFGLIKQHGVTPSIKVALRATKEQVDAKGAHFCRKL